MPKGYVVGLITVTDPEGYKAYAERTTEIVKAHGGRYLVRGGAKEVVEGDAPGDRAVVIEFESVEAARKFYESDEYTEVLKIRQANSQAAFLMRVEGCEDS